MTKLFTILSTQIGCLVLGSSRRRCQRWANLEGAAREELREEVGGRSAKWTSIGPLYSANGICNEIGHIFLARDVELGQAAHEPAEIIEIHQKPVAKVLTMARTNQIEDGSSALAILLCQSHL